MEKYPEYQNMVRDLAKPGLEIISKLTVQSAHMDHMASAMVGEIGELFEFIHTGEGGTFIEEMGDIEFYHEGLLQGLDNSARHFVESFDVMDFSEQTKLFNQFHNVSSLKAHLSLFCFASFMYDDVKKMAIYGKSLDLVSFAYHYQGFIKSMNRMYSLNRHICNRQQVLDYNMEKLLKGDTARYKSGKYSDAAAQQRADKI